jgi:hypothetical protein
MNPISSSSSFIRNHRQVAIAVIATSVLLIYYYAFPVSNSVMMNNAAEAQPDISKYKPKDFQKEKP